MNIQNVVIGDKIYESEHSLIYRGQNISDHRKVILKRLKSDQPSAWEVSKFRKEYEMTRLFQSDGIVGMYALEKVDSTHVMIIEDFGGDSLKNLMPHRSLPLVEFLKLAILMAEALGQVHQAGITHRDINPSNIIWNPESGALKLIDFGIASDLEQETPDLVNPNVLEGTLAYISPEQTGRMNRAIDHRADLYSLGMTFYEMLTGQLPFQCKDAMEWVHCHIARIPRPPHEIHPDIPEGISAILLKLLAKNAEDRYQSAWGVKADLLYCLKQLEENPSAAIPVFELGRMDGSRFRIPQKLYGRDLEILRLQETFQLVCTGNSRVMMLCGQSGIGKTALVREIHKKLVEKRGYFISGKFDQLKRNESYSALIQAFRDLIGQWLGESEEQIEIWKQRLLKALGVNGKVVTEVIPDLERIIDPQKPIPEVGPVENQNRFQYTFQQFVQALAGPSHPLVIFVDELQWADTPSLNLLQTLLTDPDIRFLMLIGAYRDNEISAGHPLIGLVEDIQQSRNNLETLHLSSLKSTHVCQLVGETVQIASLDLVEQLGQLIHRKTLGNPFFVAEFLRFLHKEQLLRYDHEQLRWTWDTAQIEARQITDNVVELLIGKISKLPAETRTALKLGACIGSTIDLRLLSRISEKPLRQTARDLWPAVQEGLLESIGEGHQLIREMDEFVEQETSTREITALDRYVHDRIQQAAYVMIPEGEHAPIHLRIGQSLWNAASEQQLEHDLFYLLSQLNRGRSLLTDPEEKIRLAELNLKASLKAKLSTAYSVALEYAQTGLELLPETPWEQQPGLTLELHLAVADAAYLARDFSLMEQFLETILQQNPSRMDLIRIYSILVSALVARNKIRESVDATREVLQRFGIKIPATPTRLHIVWPLLVCRYQLIHKSEEELLNFPLMTNPESLALLKLFSRSMGAAYMTGVNMFALYILEITRLTLSLGNNPYAGWGIGGVGQAIWSLGDIKNCIKLADIA
ncbi:MAG: serine/threonine-protein kinase PknK, partial [SAR324 cluster bacterium]|nr:serine/threonine-protein kinase PknK [SAR324 cluster bacterium]